MTESHEIDNLKRKIEDAKMKLVTEIKVQLFRFISFNCFFKKRRKVTPAGLNTRPLSYF